MKTQFMPEARREYLIVQKVDDEILLYDTANDQAHILNPTSARVWNLANGQRTVSNIALLVARELHTQPQPELIWLALEQLSKAGLLQQRALPTMLTTKMTRREFLQKASLAAMAIPMVKTISAPTPQRAVSCAQPTDPCQVDGDCCTPAVCFQLQCTCFVAGTRVLFGDGIQRPIETIRVGDLVLAREEWSGIVAPQRVEKTYIHHNRETFTLDFGTSALGTTATHPFYTDKGWVKAIDLRVGMDCYSENGSRLTLLNVEHPLPHPQTVYNLQVAGFHTYFVGEQKVWVHNRTMVEDIPTS